MKTTSTSARRTIGALLTGAVSLGMLTVGVGTGTAQAAEQVCTGTSSIYGVLDDGRLTYTAITPGNGNRVRTLIGLDLGFTPVAMATLNFNTILVTSTTGALYRIDVQTNDETLAVSAIKKIVDTGWTTTSSPTTATDTSTAPPPTAPSSSTPSPRPSPQAASTSANAPKSAPASSSKPSPAPARTASSPPPKPGSSTRTRSSVVPGSGTTSRSPAGPASTRSSPPAAATTTAA
ncbi:hypothetical protein ACK8N7_25060 [Streptomyces griseobrunneus]